MLDVIDYNQSMINEFISQAETKGYITSVEYYEALISEEQKYVSELQSEKADLITQLNEAVANGIDEASEEWYDMCNEIDNVTLAIEQGTTALLEYNKAIREINWEVFDLLEERISYITNEADFLIDLLNNRDLYTDNGQLTDQGMAAMGLHGVNYNVYMEQADQYAQQILELDKEIAEDPYNQDLQVQRESLLELQQDMILAAEDEKQAIVDMVEEGINLEIDALKSLIDETKEALNSQKD